MIRIDEEVEPVIRIPIELREQRVNKEPVESWYKNNATDLIWWKDLPDREGEWIFSFDKVKEYNMFADYLYKLTQEEKEIFDRENPYWREFFSDRQRAQDPTDLSEYRRADGMSYRIQKGFITDIAHTERILHHELDNYVMDMSKELREAMEEAEKALKKAKDLLSKEAV